MLNGSSHHINHKNDQVKTDRWHLLINQSKQVFFLTTNSKLLFDDLFLLFIQNKKSEPSYTPLHLAAIAGEDTTVESLVASGADRCAKDLKVSTKI